MRDLTEIRARAAAHDEDLESVRWPTATELAARWSVSVSTVYAIPREHLPFKAFGRGPRPRRRYRPADVAAFEAMDGGYGQPHVERSA
jgi:hypothetical protein